MKTVTALLAVLAMGCVGTTAAQNADHAADDSAYMTAAAADNVLADGEVRRVDLDAKKLTIRHGPLPALDMPTPMTMVYQVRDPALLNKVKAGDKIRFAAEKIGGQFTVTRIEPAN